MKFKDKRIVITGSTMGIGKVMAQKLGLQGASIVLNGRNPERLGKAQAELADLGLRVEAVQGDVSIMEDCERLVQTAQAHFGGIDILINNAGINMLGKIEDSSPEHLRKIMEVNYMGSLFPTMAAIPYLKESQGHLLFVGSIAGIRGLPMTTVYSSSKMALTALAEGLKIELEEHGIGVGLAYVGMTETEPDKRVFDSKGNPIPKPKFQIPPEPMDKVADRIIRMIEKEEFKVVFSRMGKLNAVFNRITPGLVHFLLRRNFRKLSEDLDV